MPADPGDRAMVRKWMIRLDGGLHMQVASISFAVAFRHQVLAARPTPEALEEYYRAVPDYGRRLAMREMIEQGFESLNLQIAVKGYEKLLADMDQALEEHPWLVGDRWSLADIAYLPYIVRLEHLQLQHWWADRPKLAGWLERAKAMNSYKKGMVEWFNPKYLELMKAEGEAAWPRIQALLEQP
jgi:glutathione S-transferase